MLDDLDVDLVRVEGHARGARDRRVARGVGDERLDGGFLGLPGSTPARPVDRGREHLLRARLDRDVDLHGRPVAAARSATRRAIPSTSVPSSPSASTSADATITPPAPAFAMDRTWTGRLTPNPTPTGTGEAATTSRTRRPTVGGSVSRAPVTPTSDTQ